MHPSQSLSPRRGGKPRSHILYTQSCSWVSSMDSGGYKCEGCASGTSFKWHDLKQKNYTKSTRWNRASLQTSPMNFERLLHWYLARPSRLQAEQIMTVLEKMQESYIETPKGCSDLSTNYLIFQRSNREAWNWEFHLWMSFRYCDLSSFRLPPTLNEKISRWSSIHRPMRSLHILIKKKSSGW